MDWSSGKHQAKATAGHLKIRLKHHAEVVHDGKPSDDCLGCQELLRLIRKKESEKKK